jgi:hypothetical protein
MPEVPQSLKRLVHEEQKVTFRAIYARWSVASFSNNTSLAKYDAVM